MKKSKKEMNCPLLKTKTVKPASSEEDWDMLPDVEELEIIVNRELKKLEEFEIANTQKEQEITP